MAAADTLALWVPDEIAGGPPSAFIDDHEFCHIHALPHASLHLTLPDTVRRQAINTGWAAPHPSGVAGFLPETLVMVFAPRRQDELDMVFHLVTVSYRFALGELGSR